MLWSDWKGKLSLEDTHTNGNETFILEDPQQDCRDFQIEFLPNTIHFMFKRKFDSCDENDYTLEVSVLKYSAISTISDESGTRNWVFGYLGISREMGSTRLFLICCTKIWGEMKKSLCSTCLFNPFLDGTSKTRNPSFRVSDPSLVTLN